MTSNGVLASQRAAVIENIYDDLTAIRILTEDIDEWADHPDSSIFQCNFVLNALMGKTEALLTDLGEAFELLKKS